MPPWSTASQYYAVGQGGSRFGPRRTLTIVMTLAALVAGLTVWIATQPPGPGLDPDAMAYTGAAHSLATTGTLRVPTSSWADDDSTTSLSLWPPGYPAAIAIPVLTGLSPIQGGRWVVIAAAALSAATIVALVGSITTPLVSVVAVVVVFVTPAIFGVHLSVLSEPLFIALLLLTATGMVAARDRPSDNRLESRASRLGHPIILGGLAALTVMTRYAGIAAVLAVLLWMLLDDTMALKERVRRTIAAGVLPAVAIGGWLLRTGLLNDRHGTPHVRLYGGWIETLHQAGTTLVQWMVPGMPANGLRVGLALVIGAVIVALLSVTERDTIGFRLRSPQSARLGTAISTLAMLAGCYVLTIVAARAFVGGTIPFDWRILAPLLVLCNVMIVLAAAHWWRAVNRPFHVMIGALAILWIAASTRVTAAAAYDAMTDGSDFAASAWRTSPMLRWVRDHGTGRTIYSNWPAAVYFHTGRIARELPDSVEARTLLDEFAQTFRESHGVLVGFTERSPDVVAPDSLAAQLGLSEIERFPDGIVWGM